MELMGQREVRAPVREWLTRLEVVTILGISESTLSDLIDAGEFPQGVPWTGRERRWKWSDIVWRELHLEIIARLTGHLPDPPAPTPKRRTDAPG